MSDSQPSWLIGSGLDTDLTQDKAISGSKLRFWIPKGSMKRVIFLTAGDQAPVIWEHQLKLNGNWNNFVTCTKPIGVPCPVCEWSDKNNGEFKRYKAAFFTVIDCTEFADKSGKVIKNVKRLMCCKSSTAEKLKRKWLRLQDDKKSMLGAMFEIFRPSLDKSAAVGEDFEYVKHVDLETLKDATEFDYSEVLQPNPDVAAALVENLNNERRPSAATPAKSYDVPF